MSQFRCNPKRVCPCKKPLFCRTKVEEQFGANGCGKPESGSCGFVRMTCLELGCYRRRTPRFLFLNQLGDHTQVSNESLHLGFSGFVILRPKNGRRMNRGKDVRCQWRGNRSASLLGDAKCFFPAAPARRLLRGIPTLWASPLPVPRQAKAGKPQSRNDAVFCESFVFHEEPPPT